jgi:hypothetical protein
MPCSFVRCKSDVGQASHYDGMRLIRDEVAGLESYRKYLWKTNDIIAKTPIKGVIKPEKAELWETDPDQITDDDFYFPEPQYLVRSGVTNAAGAFCFFSFQSWVDECTVRNAPLANYYTTKEARAANKIYRASPQYAFDKTKQVADKINQDASSSSGPSYLQPLMQRGDSTQSGPSQPSQASTQAPTLPSKPAVGPDQWRAHRNDQVPCYYCHSVAQKEPNNPKGKEGEFLESFEIINNLRLAVLASNHSRNTCPFSNCCWCRVSGHQGINCPERKSQQPRPQ